jgi:putative addiction module component (TIGR02574 family)
VNKAALLVEIMRLPDDERGQLVEDLLVSLHSDGHDSSDKHDFSLSPPQEADFDRRLEEHKRDPSSAIPFEDVIASLRPRFR